MTKALIIVESPTKIKTLKKFLPKGFHFESSIGHIRDLPPKKFGIDVDNGFTPQYEILEGKKDVITNLQKAAKSVDIVYLSPDPDREGEAIAWHIAEILPKGTNYKRVTFNEITKDAVLNAIQEPRDIDPHLVDAQQARRLLDRMVGYKLSPILQRKILRGTRSGSLSAGRVQSVALKLVVIREKEIQAFVPVEYWNLGSFLGKTSESKQFQANLYSVDGKKVEKEAVEGKDVFLISNEKTAKEIEEELKTGSYVVEKVDRREKKRNPSPPFITSTLQQEASRHYGFSAARTMNIAQSLYEGIELGSEGPEGLITYMRTDSVRIAPEATEQAKEYIKRTYGSEFLPPKPPVYSSKKHTQDAHEAIRPTNLSHAPNDIKSDLTTDQFKIYTLIWKRFIASQMKPAVYDTVSANIRASNRLLLRATGSIIKFPGHLSVYEEKGDSDDEKTEERRLPELAVGDKLNLLETFASQSFTKPPPRYTEASLVKELEKSGIGRPSTYASIMQKIHGRSYTEKEKSYLKPTELGMIIIQMLEENFDNIMDIGFTARMENELDKIAETDVDWKIFLEDFWKNFIPKVERAEKEAYVPKIPTELTCPECKKGQLQKIWSRDRYFYGCSNYPDCKYTSPLEELTINKEEYADNFDWDQSCPKCGSEMKPRKSRYGIFLGCSNYPECKGIINIPKKGEPLPDELPSCPAIGCDGQIVAKRSRFGKTFFSCSTFPDCNVIANSLDELAEKYKHHERAPYEKKPRGKGKATATRTAKKKTTTKSTKTTKKEKKPRKQPIYQLSKELSTLLGKSELTRQEVTRGLWDYIKANDRQGKDNKRIIHPDDKLATVFGSEKPIDMLQLAGIISKHLIPQK